MNPAVEGLRDLGIDLTAKPRQATERCLDMPARAAKPVVKIEVTKGGIEIVEPHQSHHAAAEPDAFRVPGRAVDDLRCFGEFIRLVLIVVLGRVSGLTSIWSRFARLILGVSIAALGGRASSADEQCESGDGEVA
jgi:hypothetical protein